MKKEVDIIQELRLQIVRKYKNQEQAAVAWGVSRTFVSRVLNNKAFPTQSMLDDVGCERITTTATKYQRVK